MNYIWNFIKYFYGEENNLTKQDFVRDVIDEFYKRYKLKVVFNVLDSCVLENKSGICEIKYNQTANVMVSFKNRELFTLGGHKIPSLGSKRNKDEFYKILYLELV